MLLGLLISLISLSPPHLTGQSNCGAPRLHTHTHIHCSLLCVIQSLTLCTVLLQSTRPLYSFEDSCDYVYDAMWSPTHPAMFACVDLSGRLDLWNLNNDTEVCTHTNAYKYKYKDKCSLLGNKLTSVCISRFPLLVCL